MQLFRIAKAYKELHKGHKNEGQDPSVLLVFDNGYFTTVVGSGSLCNYFLSEKTLHDYTGKHFKVRMPTDPDYQQARLRYLPFDRCFSFSDDDVDNREYNQFITG